MRLGLDKDAKTIAAGGVSTLLGSGGRRPAYIGVGYIIGPELGALNFAGGLLAWGLFVPLLVFFLGPSMIDQYTATAVRRLGALVDPTSSSSSSGRSPSAACSSAPATPSTGCART